VFHFIQAAEKAVKGLLYFFNLQPWGHSLSGLLMECEKQGIGVKPEFKVSAKSFDVHYTGTRYPDASPTPPRKAYDKAMAETIKNKPMQ
jgi:HEPN domain-containing protein